MPHAPPLVLGDELAAQIPDESVRAESREDPGFEDPAILVDRALAVVGLVDEVFLCELAEGARLPRGELPRLDLLRSLIELLPGLLLGRPF